ncbi:hypothetical protein ADL03_01710 [Nocardia sp. NRRL S-836]|nr:hypothetical protein ADL03_01710 [Nocardia sp. NRRL S-836]
MVGVDGTPASNAALEWAVVRESTVNRVQLTEIAQLSLRGCAPEALETVSEGAALLVVTSHTGHWTRQIVLGSTSTHVVRHAHAPVVVIPATDRETAGATR